MLLLFLGADVLLWLGLGEVTESLNFGFVFCEIQVRSPFFKLEVARDENMAI